MKKREVGRIRIPGKPDIYLGSVGSWPARQKNPPANILNEYRRIIADWLASGGESRPESVSAGGVTIAQLVKLYAKHVAKNYRKRDRPTSRLRQVINATTPLLRLFPVLPVALFGAKESRAVRDELLRNGKRGKGTIQTYGSALRAMFSWGEQEGLVPETVAVVVRGTRWFGRGQQARRTPGRKRPVILEDVQKTLPELPAAPRAMVELQLLTGMRPEEVCFMRAGDFTEDGDLLRYDARDDCNKLAHLGVAKTVYLGPRCKEIISVFLTRSRAVGPDAWLFCAPKAWVRGNGHYSPAYYGNVIREACKRAGVKRWSVGALRHTRLSETRRRYDKEHAQAEAGHLNPHQVGVYTDSVLDELARKVARETG